MLPVIYSFQLTQLIGMQLNKSADPADSRGKASENGGQEGQEARGRTAMVFWPCGAVLSGAVQDESRLQEDARKLEARNTVP